MGLLKRSGFDFHVHRTRGIPHRIFAEHFMISGLCLNPSINWITFHGSVDFGYLLKSLIGYAPLPQDESAFFDLMKTYLVNYFDVKEIKRDFIHLNQSGGLAKLAKDLEVERIGTIHQAGSDSLITLQVFFKIKELHKKWVVQNSNADFESRFNGFIYGLGESQNDDPYIDEYKNLTLEYSQHNGKPINLNSL